MKHLIVFLLGFLSLPAALSSEGKLISKTRKIKKCMEYIEGGRTEDSPFIAFSDIDFKYYCIYYPGTNREIASLKHGGFYRVEGETTRAGCGVFRVGSSCRP